MLKRSDVHWFPMRVSYSSAPRLARLKDLLEQDEAVQATYVAMQYKKVRGVMKFTPAVENLIFVRSSLDRLSVIKRTGPFVVLRYIMHPVIENDGWKHTEPLMVPDAHMDDFIRVTAEANDKVIYLDNLDFACRPGQRVQITDGTFAGVMGVIKRIQGNVCVVIPIQHTIAAAITGIPRKHLRYLPDNEPDN